MVTATSSQKVNNDIAIFSFFMRLFYILLSVCVCVCVCVCEQSRNPECLVTLINTNLN